MVVAYQSRDRLRDCVLPLLGLHGVRVIVADNASPDRGIETLADLDVTCLRLPRNGGFSYGCNAGWTAGRGDVRAAAQPGRDARRRLPAGPRRGAGRRRAGRRGRPADRGRDGHREPSLRRYPRLRSTYAQALFLHRVFRRASWTDELMQDPAAYERPGAREWVSGACMLRAAQRARGARRPGRRVLPVLRGHRHLQAPRGSRLRRPLRARRDCRARRRRSRPRAELYGVLAASRIRYARKHRSRLVSAVERAGIVLGALTHCVLSPDRAAPGYRVALRAALRGAAPPMVEAEARRRDRPNGRCSTCHRRPSLERR